MEHEGKKWAAKVIGGIVLAVGIVIIVVQILTWMGKM